MPPLAALIQQLRVTLKQRRRHQVLSVECSAEQVIENGLDERWIELQTLDK